MITKPKKKVRKRKRNPEIEWGYYWVLPIGELKKVSKSPFIMYIPKNRFHLDEKGNEQEYKNVYIFDGKQMLQYTYNAKKSDKFFKILTSSNSFFEEIKNDALLIYLGSFGADSYPHGWEI